MREGNIVSLSFVNSGYTAAGAQEGLVVARGTKPEHASSGVVTGRVADRKQIQDSSLVVARRPSISIEIAPKVPVVGAPSSGAGSDNEDGLVMDIFAVRDPHPAEEVDAPGQQESEDQLTDSVFGDSRETQGSPDTAPAGKRRARRVGPAAAAIVTAATVSLAACSPPEGPVFSTDAGYSVVGENSIKEVEAEFTVPTIISCPKDVFSALGVWAGIRGSKEQQWSDDPTLEQDGLLIECAQDGDPSYKLFIEMYPQAPTISNKSVNPGDVIIADVRQDKDGHFTLTVRDTNTGAAMEETAGCPTDSCPPDQAAVIAEEVVDQTSSEGHLPVWTGLMVLKATVTEGNRTKPLYELPHVKARDITSAVHANQVLAQPVPLPMGKYKIERVHRLDKQ